MIANTLASWSDVSYLVQSRHRTSIGCLSSANVYSDQRSSLQIMKRAFVAQYCAVTHFDLLPLFTLLSILEDALCSSIQKVNHGAHDDSAVKGDGGRFSESLPAVKHCDSRLIA